MRFLRRTAPPSITSCWNSNEEQSHEKTTPTFLLFVARFSAHRKDEFRANHIGPSDNPASPVNAHWPQRLAIGFRDPGTGYRPVGHAVASDAGQGQEPDSVRANTRYENRYRDLQRRHGMDGSCRQPQAADGIRCPAS